MSNFVSDSIVTLFANLPIVQRLLAAGKETLTETSVVSSRIGDGEIVIVASVTLSTFSMFSAICLASDSFAPGTMTCRAASYEAFSTTWRRRLNRANSIPAITNSMMRGRTTANSTVCAPLRVIRLAMRSFSFICALFATWKSGWEVGEQYL